MIFRCLQKKSGVSGFCLSAVKVLGKPVQMNRAELTPTPLVYIITPVKACVKAWLALGTLNGTVYTYPQHLLLQCL